MRSSAQGARHRGGGRELDTPNAPDRARIQARLTARSRCCICGHREPGRRDAAPKRRDVGQAASAGCAGAARCSCGRRQRSARGHALSARVRRPAWLQRARRLGRARCQGDCAADRCGAQRRGRRDDAAREARGRGGHTHRAERGHRSPASGESVGSRVDRWARDRPVATTLKSKATRKGARNATFARLQRARLELAGRTVPSARSDDRATPARPWSTGHPPAASAARAAVASHAAGHADPAQPWFQLQPRGYTIESGPADSCTGGPPWTLRRPAAASSLPVPEPAPAPVSPGAPSRKPPVASTTEARRAGPVTGARLLAQAQRALRDGRLAQALELLDEHGPFLRSLLKSGTPRGR